MSRINKCPQCGFQNEANASTCSSCGFTLEDTQMLPETIYCPNCRAELELEIDERKNRRFICPKCNSSIDLSKRITEEPSKEEKGEGSSKSGKIWLRRGFAFAIDYAIIGTVWGIIDNLIWLPIPDGIVSIGMGILFCLYFAFFEGKGDFRASPGKRITKIRIVTENNELPSPRAIVKRSIILALILIIAWDEILALLFAREIPSPVLILTWTIPAGLIIYNAFLAIWNSEGVMLQDGLTTTKVARITGELERKSNTAEYSVSPAQNRNWPRPVLGFSIVVVISLMGIIGYLMIDPSLSYFNQQEAIEKSLREDLNLRSRAEVTDEIILKEKKNGSPHNLIIDVWIPFISWDNHPIEEVIKVALQSVQVKIGYYESGTITIWTGFENINFKRTFDINLPKTES